MKANHLRVSRANILLAMLPVAALAACSSPTPAPPQPTRPAPSPAPQTAPPLSPAPVDWRNAPQTDGRWYWAMEGERSVAQYSARGAPPVASLTCDPAQNAMILWRNGYATSQVPLVVTTTGTRRLLNAAPAGPSGASATLQSADPLLDAMAFSRGRFMLEMTGGTTLYLPAWPELSRVIEDCRGLASRKGSSGAGSGPKR